MIRKLLLLLGTAPRLGIGNVLFVLYYRAFKRSGFLARQFPVRRVERPEPLFSERETAAGFPAAWRTPLLERADRILEGTLPYYSCHWMKQARPPNWFLNTFNGKECLGYRKHWTAISDFSEEYGDVKNIWELSRFSWAGILARAYAVSGKAEYLRTLNGWTGDWIDKNPVNRGPNWKCGQETSFRVFSLLHAAHILEQAGRPTKTLVRLIGLHLERIAGNIRYAYAQRNNHATSEAAALYIGGHWMLHAGAVDRKRFLGYAEKGRKGLERMAGKLTYPDGGFAQHSAVYHRLFLDTVTLALFWTKKLGLEPFSQNFMERAGRSLDWMLSIMDASGRCPNFGSNDGTMLLSGHSCEYGDFRPSVQTASVMIRGRRVFGPGAFDEPLYWMDAGRRTEELPTDPFRKENRFNGSGTVVMAGASSWAMLRYPFYRFRPSHNDVFHFDLWNSGENLLFDSGSYSYNPDKGSGAPDLKSVRSHNTLSFDGEEQMPRIGRFLQAKWIKPSFLGAIEEDGEEGYSWEGSYRNASDNHHWGRVTWQGNRWEVRDRFSGKARSVELGFNFAAGRHTLDPENQLLSLPWGTIRISGQVDLDVRAQTVSPCYMKAREALRLVITTKNNGEVATTIRIES